VAGRGLRTFFIVASAVIEPAEYALSDFKTQSRSFFRKGGTQYP